MYIILYIILYIIYIIIYYTVSRLAGGVVFHIEVLV